MPDSSTALTWPCAEWASLAAREKATRRCSTPWLPQHGRRHLQNPHHQSRELGQSVLAIVMANALVLHVKQIRQFADLEAVAGGQNHGVASLLQLFHDGLEERNVRRILQINPNLLTRRFFDNLRPGIRKGGHGRFGRGWFYHRRIGTTFSCERL